MSGFLDSNFVLIAFVMGLAGSAHCMGMCGGFAVLAGVGRAEGRTSLPFVTSWLAGKTVTYAVLGAIIGALSAALPGSVTGFQTAVVVFTALLLILTGLHLAGVVPSWFLFAPAPVSSFVTRMSSAVKKSSVGGRFVLGLFNGVLPCGLVYAALAYSLTLHSLWKGAVFMAVFGIGTAPVLALIGFGTGLISTARRQTVTRVVGWLVVILGLLTLTRLPAFMETMHSGHAM